MNVNKIILIETSAFLLDGDEDVVHEEGEAEVGMMNEDVGGDVMESEGVIGEVMMSFGEEFEECVVGEEGVMGEDKEVLVDEEH